MRALLLTSALLACSPHVVAAAPASPAAPSATAPAASSDPCPMWSIAAVEAIPIDDALAHPIDDRETLRLIQQIALVPAKNQFGALASMLKTGESAPNPTVGAAVTKECLGKEVAYRTVRAVALVLNTWDKSTVIGDRVDKLSAIVQNAVSALAVRDALPKETVAAALAPFATLPPVPEPPVSPAGAPCTTPDHGPSVFTQRQPDYPASASANKESGVVQVLVSLDAGGYVRAASILKAAASQPPVDSDLVDAALFAAASSVYAPAANGCKPEPSTMIMRESFVLSNEQK